MIDNLETDCCRNTIPQKDTIGIKRTWYKLKLWIYLNVWCRHLYARVMKFIHKFNIHQTTINPLSEPGEEDHWCQWCGLRGKKWIYTEPPHSNPQV